MQPGRYENIPAHEYHAWPLMSNSQRAEFMKSPADWKLAINGDKYATKAMDFGSLVHAAVLTPHETESLLAIGPEVNRNAKEWKNFAAENAGKILMKPSEYEPVLTCRDTILAHPIAKKCLSQGVPEVSYVWREKTSGLLCKSRADLEDQDNGILYDLKKVANGRSETEAFTKHVVTYQYYIQAAFYLDAANVAMKKDVFNAFVFITVEENPPHNVAVHRLSDDFVEMGRQEYKFDLQKIKTYLETPEAERWDGLPCEFNEIYPPAWMTKQREILEVA
jgi:hypothetical protein